MVKIFLDPGHGGSDSGAVENGLEEKNSTLEIATRVKDILEKEYKDVTIRLSRSTDRTVSLNERTEAANSWSADIFVSIHVNAGGGTGFESYVYPNIGEPTKNHQKNIHDEILNLVDFNDRGRKQADFYVLGETNMPAVLTENGFIDNASDATKLKSSSYINKLARGHVNGLVRAFHLFKKPSIPSTNTLYKVQIGAFKKRSNAEGLADRADAKGFEQVIKLEEGLYKVQIGTFAKRSNAEELATRAKKAGFDTLIITD